MQEIGPSIQKEYKMKEKIIIFGSGASAVFSMEMINKRNDFEVVAIWDNNESKWGVFLEGIEICKPGTNYSGIEKIVVCSVYYDEIYSQLINVLNIGADNIFNRNYCKKYIKQDIYDLYDDSTDNEIREIVEWVKNNDLEIFNYDFVEQVKGGQIEVIMDEECGMFYHIWNGKKMYLKRSFNTVQRAKEYIQSLYIEQFEKSPHCYNLEGCEVRPGSVVVDAGAAEGFFSLDIIDIVEKIFIVEPDQEWIEALKKTFANWSEKIEIIPLFLSDTASNSSITLDELDKKKSVDFVKMDIEGFEKEALEGAKKLLKKDHLSMLVCTYHKNEDEEKIGNILRDNDFSISQSSGYMCFLYGDVSSPKLVRGIMGGRK